MTKNNYFNVLLISWSWILAWLLNYIYHPIMLQFLTIEAFWEFASLLGIFNILWVLISWIVLFLNKEYSKNIWDITKQNFIFKNSLKLFFLLWCWVFFIYCLSSFIIQDFLWIESIWLVIITGVSMIFWFLSSSIDSLLRSLKKFHIIALLQVVWPITKLAFWVWLVWIWCKVYWAIGWVILSGLIWFMISFFYITRYFKWVKSESNISELLQEFRKNKKSIMNYLLVSLFFALFMNIDIILAKNIFSAEQAWIYAGVSVLWKFLIFMFLSIETVYYWQIMEYKKENLPNHLIKNPLVLITVWSISALVVNYFIGWFILNILKAELAEYTKIYLLILGFYSLLAFISFFAKILIWWGKYWVNYIFWILSILLISFAYLFWQSSLENFVYSFIISWSIGVFLIWYMFFYELKKENK